MFEQKYFVIFNVLSFIILVILFHKFHARQSIPGFLHPVRFCGQKQHYESFDNIQLSLLSTNKTIDEINPVYGEPACFLDEVDQNWTFLIVIHFN